MYRLFHEYKHNHNQDINFLSRSHSQYLKQNRHPNITIDTQINYKGDYQKNHSNTIQKLSPITKTKSVEKKKGQPKSMQKNNKKTIQKVLNKQNSVKKDEDFIQLQDVGMQMNNKGVLNQLQNAMKRQIQKQKIEIENLNETILSLQQKDKTQNTEIENLSQCIKQLVHQLSELKLQKEHSSIYQNQQQIFQLQEENNILKNKMEEMEEMIKDLLLQREKQRLFYRPNTI